MNVEAKAMAPEPSAISFADGPAAGFVRDMQRDGRLLLRHVTRRTDRVLAAATTATGNGQPMLGLLTAPAGEIAASETKMEALAACVDALSRQAAPATPTTICTTNGYLHIQVDECAPSEQETRRIARLRWTFRSIIGLAAAAMLAALALLAHVDYGRRAVQQLQETRQEIRDAYDVMRKLPDGAWLPDARHAAALPGEFLGFCPGDDENGLRPAAGQLGAQAQAACSARYEAWLRQGLVFSRLAAWNCRTHRYLLPWHLASSGCGAPVNPPPEPVQLVDWTRTEMRTSGAISELTGFVLPLLLGCIGGCAFVLRRVAQKLSDFTLELKDGPQAPLRVLLATMLGGLLGVVWSGDQPMQLGGYTLSIAAAAFFVGFALEAVFTVIEALVDGVVAKMRNPPAAQPTVIVAARPAG